MSTPPDVPSDVESGAASGATSGPMAPVAHIAPATLATHTAPTAPTQTPRSYEDFMMDMARSGLVHPTFFVSPLGWELYHRLQGRHPPPGVFPGAGATQAARVVQPSVTAAQVPMVVPVTTVTPVTAVTPVGQHPTAVSLGTLVAPVPAAPSAPPAHPAYTVQQHTTVHRVAPGVAPGVAPAIGPAVTGRDVTTSVIQQLVRSLLVAPMARALGTDAFDAVTAMLNLAQPGGTQLPMGFVIELDLGEPGLSDAQIAALPRHTPTTASDVCSICLESPVGQVSVALPCQHSFHEACVVQWLRESTQCPNCRAEVAPAATESDADDTDSDTSADTQSESVSEMETESDFEPPRPATRRRRTLADLRPTRRNGQSQPSQRGRTQDRHNERTTFRRTIGSRDLYRVLSRHGVTDRFDSNDDLMDALHEYATADDLRMLLATAGLDIDLQDSDDDDVDSSDDDYFEVLFECVCRVVRLR